MTDKVNLDRIKTLIQALMAKTTKNGCTEEEAMSAMNKIGELLDTYNLSMDEVELRQQDFITENAEFDGKNRSHESQYLVYLSTYLNCKVWHNRKVENLTYSFFGMKEDVMVAKYFIQVIEHAIDYEANQYKTSENYTKFLESIENCSAGFKRAKMRDIIRSFRMGMARRISTRFKTMIDERNRSQANNQKYGALVIVKNQLVEAEFSKLNMKLTKSTHTKNTFDADAYYSGQSKGDSVNLNRPLEKNATKAVIE